MKRRRRVTITQKLARKLRIAQGLEPPKKRRKRPEPRIGGHLRVPSIFERPLDDEGRLE